MHAALGCHRHCKRLSPAQAYTVFGDEHYWRVFQDAYAAVTSNLRPRAHPLFVNVDMRSAAIFNRWTDSLQAFLPALQVRVCAFLPALQVRVCARSCCTPAAACEQL
jgi:hypothetical protein